MSGTEKVDSDHQILSRLYKIEHTFDSIEHTIAFALRAEQEKHFGTVKSIFKNSKRKAQVYLAADGSRGVGEIADFLGMKRQNVGSELKLLADEGLLELIDNSGGRDIWGKKPLDRSLRISHFLTSEFQLDRSGKPKEASSKKRQGPKKQSKAKKASRRRG